MKFALIVLSVLTLTFTTVTFDTWAVNQVLDLDGGGAYVEIPPSDSLDITGAISMGNWQQSEIGPVSSFQTTHRLKLERTTPNIGPVCLMKSASGIAHAPTKRSSQQ